MDFIIEHCYDSEKNAWLATISGEIDIFNSGEMKSKLLDLINEKNVDIYIDCKKLEYLDSTALGALVAVLKNVKAYGGEMHLLGIRPNLKKLFKITNLDKVFIIEGEHNE